MTDSEKLDALAIETGTLKYALRDQLILSDAMLVFLRLLTKKAGYDDGKVFEMLRQEQTDAAYRVSKDLGLPLPIFEDEEAI